MVSFFSAASCKKDTIYGAARKIFVPSYFMTALARGFKMSWSSSKNPTTILTLVMMGQLFLLLALVATRFHIKPCVFEKDGMTWTDISCGLHSKGNWGLLHTHNGLNEELFLFYYYYYYYYLHFYLTLVIHPATNSRTIIL